MNNDNKDVSKSQNRIIYGIIKDIFILVGIGVIYFIFISFTGISIPCFYKQMFGFQCGTCGVTRMMVASAHLDFRRAFGYNHFLFISFPVLVVEIIYIFYNKERKTKLPKWNWVALYIYLGLLVLYGILRNVLPI